MIECIYTYDEQYAHYTLLYTPLRHAFSFQIHFIIVKNCGFSYGLGLYYRTCTVEFPTDFLGDRTQRLANSFVGCGKFPRQQLTI